MENEDADPDVIRLVLDKLKSSCSSAEEFASIVNYRMKASTVKWKIMFFVVKNAYRTGLSNSGLMNEMSLWCGNTALNFAVARGDIDIVKLLLKNGADPYVANDLGMNAFEICDKTGPFPSVRRELDEWIRLY